MEKHQKQKSGTAAVSLGIAAVLITAGVFGLGGFFAHSQTAMGQAAATGPVAAADALAPADPQGPDGLETLVYLAGNTLPDGAVSAQYAIAKAAEIAERVYSAPLTGRVFCRLNDSENRLSDSYGVDGLYWNIDAETKDGRVMVGVDASTGIDFQGGIVPVASNWQWFDEWNEEDAETERLEMERGLSEQVPYENPSIDDLASLQTEKCRYMLEFSESMKDTPYAARGIEYANQLNLGNGAQAVSGAVRVGDADPGDETMFQVEVSLDDGTYLFLSINNDDAMQLTNYMRSSMDYQQFSYPHAAL